MAIGQWAPPAADENNTPKATCQPPPPLMPFPRAVTDRHRVSAEDNGAPGPYIVLASFSMRAPVRSRLF